MTHDMREYPAGAGRRGDGGPGLCGGGWCLHRAHRSHRLRGRDSLDQDRWGVRSPMQDVTGCIFAQAVRGERQDTGSATARRAGTMDNIHNM